MISPSSGEESKRVLAVLLSHVETCTHPVEPLALEPNATQASRRAIPPLIREAKGIQNKEHMNSHHDLNKSIQLDPPFY